MTCTASLPYHKTTYKGAFQRCGAVTLGYVLLCTRPRAVLPRLELLASTPFYLLGRAYVSPCSFTLSKLPSGKTRILREPATLLRRFTYLNGRTKSRRFTVL